MFTSPAPPTPSAPTLSITGTTLSASVASPTRSRLRGLSILRNYTHNHLHGSGSGGRQGHSRSESETGALSSAVAGTDTAQLSRARSQVLRGENSSRPAASGTEARAPCIVGSCSIAPPQSQALQATPSNPSTVATATGWLPGGRQEPQANTTPRSDTTPNTMTRTRAETVGPVLSRPTTSPTVVQSPAHSGTTNVNNPSLSDITTEANMSKSMLPTIRFVPHHDPRSTRPSLSFPVISRTLPTQTSVIRVGRYSERETLPEAAANVPSAAPVGFKSKVVSRRHCEFWCSGGQWFVRDVKSSSGTFLNHLRLSPPGAESKPWPVNDGDVVQLGIDFRGGEEMIFRCVKMRVECNRGWQKGLNTFNKTTHKRLQNLTRTKKDSDSASVHTSECSICLMSIAPCQSLFVAPCSHVWHYKCIRPILNGSTYPHFLCPNCRAVADLEADLDDQSGEWDDDGAEKDELELPLEGPAEAVAARIDAAIAQNTRVRQSPSSFSQARESGENGENIENLNQAVRAVDSNEAASSSPAVVIYDSESPAQSSALLAAIPMAVRQTEGNDVEGYEGRPEGPMTPRNDIGPFVLDGGAGR
ncbi:SMAD/FHA domain-containing protein, partial [Trichodelitschia bisporula]